jgi:hypothetical protein
MLAATSFHFALMPEKRLFSAHRESDLQATSPTWRSISRSAKEDLCIGEHQAIVSLTATASHALSDRNSLWDFLFCDCTEFSRMIGYADRRKKGGWRRARMEAWQCTRRSMG